MVLQTSVNAKQAFGVPGSFYDQSPKRVAPYVLTSDATNYVGYAYTSDAANDPKSARAGGAGKFVGVLVNAKQYALKNDLTATLAVEAGTVGELCSFGHIVVVCQTAFTPGQVVSFNPDTGAISSADSADAIAAGDTLIENAQIVFESGAAGELAVLELGN